MSAEIPHLADGLREKGNPAVEERFIAPATATKKPLAYLTCCTTRAQLGSFLNNNQVQDNKQFLVIGIRPLF